MSSTSVFDNERRTVPIATSRLGLPHSPPSFCLMNRSHPTLSSLLDLRQPFYNLSFKPKYSCLQPTESQGRRRDKQPALQSHPIPLWELPLRLRLRPPRRIELQLHRESVKRQHENQVQHLSPSQRKLRLRGVLSGKR